MINVKYECIIEKLNSRVTNILQFNKNKNFAFIFRVLTIIENPISNENIKHILTPYNLSLTPGLHGLQVF